MLPSRCRRPSAQPARSSGSIAQKVKSLFRCSSGGLDRGVRQPETRLARTGAPTLPGFFAGYGFITCEGSEDEVFVHQVRKGWRLQAGSRRRCRGGGACTSGPPVPRLRVSL